MSEDTGRYHWLSRLFHWGMALGIFGLMAVGWYMGELDPKSELRGELRNLHKATGMLMLVLLLARVVWTRVVPAPDFPPTITHKEQKISSVMFKLLYLAMLLMPLTGYLWSATGGYPISFYGLFDVPLVPKHEAYFDLGHDIHEWAVYCGAALISLHILAAMKHHFVAKDGMLKRML